MVLTKQAFIPEGVHSGRGASVTQAEQTVAVEASKLKCTRLDPSYHKHTKLGTVAQVL